MSEHIETTAGNMAAMRKALERITEWFDEGGWSEEAEEEMDAMLESACAALSAPARNCDRFVDELDAQLAFLNEEWLIDVNRKTMLVKDQFENWTCHMRSRYARWLMAPAAKKQKGEQNEEQSRH